MELVDLKSVFMKYSWLIVLVIIFLFSYYIRVMNIVPDRILSFDPVFQYRFTYYFANWHHLPVWDELTYYVGRLTSAEVSPLMFYLTALVYWIQPFKLSLLTVASYLSAFYGAMIVIAAFLLGRELSNKYGGLLAATFVGTAPQILVRTFGSSYDTDQLVLFFIILTLYLGFYALKKRTIASFCFALIGFVAFMLTWGMFTYTIIILVGFVIIYFIMSCLMKNMKREENIIKPKFSEILKMSLFEFKNYIIILLGIVIGLVLIGFIVQQTPLSSFLAVIGFAQTPERAIVNVSIAELQPFNIFNLDGWILAMGNLRIGDKIIDVLIFLCFIALMIFGVFKSYKKDLKITAFLLTLFLIAIYTTFHGIRFTEFSSALFIILVSAGFGYFVEWSLKKDNFLKTISIGLGIILAVFALFLGLQMGQNLGPDINQNWDDAWNFLKTQTPELSIVGTWWDPGHMINGLAERRNYADGAHCPDTISCKYGINDRITNLGKIMATDNENESLELIRKYQGNSPKVYWIASDDLIGKFQWLQYFGLGCDARKEQRCPLYYQIPQQQVIYTTEGNPGIIYYGNIVVLLGGNVPIPIFIQNKNAYLFSEIMYYENAEIKSLTFDANQTALLIQMLKQFEQQLNAQFSNQTIQLTAWIPQHYAYIVLIPPNQRNNVFTRMFFLEGQDLEHFKQVFRNEQVKIYEVEL